MVKIPTFNNELQQTNQSGSIGLSVTANPGALSAGDAAGAQIGNAIQQAGAVVNQFAQKEKQMRDAIEASEILQRVSTITSELETVSLGKGLLDRDSYHNRNLENLKTSILNGGDFSYDYDDTTNPISVNGNGKPIYATLTKNYAGSDGFKPPSNKAVKRLLTSELIDLFATSTKGVHKSVTAETIENTKFVFDKNNKLQVNTMLEATKNGDLNSLYTTGLNQFGLDMNPQSDTYYLKLLSQGIDPKVGISQYEHIAATSTYSAAAAAELEIKDWQDFLKREIDLRENEFVGLAFDEVGPAYDMLMQDLRANPKYNNLEYGLSPDAISKRIEELDDARTREVNRALSLENKIETAEEDFISDSQEAMEQEIIQDIVGGIEEVTTATIQDLLVNGRVFIDQYGKERTIKITGTQELNLLKRLRGQYDVDDFNYKRELMTKISQATSIEKIIDIQKEFAKNSARFKTESQQQMIGAIENAINNNQHFNLYNNNKDQLEASIGYNMDFGTSSIPKYEDLTLQQETLDYYDRLVWSGKYEMTPEVARAQAQNYYRKNVNQDWREFGLTLPGFVLKELGTNPSNWTSVTLENARATISDKMKKGSFPLGALVFADEKLKSIQAQAKWNENVNQKDNKKIGTGDSELNFEELAAKANIDTVTAFEKTDTGKKINQIKGIK